MGKSLREALQEQLALLQSRGLAPEELPGEAEQAVEAPPNGRATAVSPRGERGHPPRRGAARSRPADERIPREHRSTGRRLGPRRPTGGASGPLDRSQPEVHRPPGVGALLERRAQERRQEERFREELSAALSAVGGRELEAEEVKRFLSALERDTGALPPVEVAVEAIREANSLDPKQVGEAVRRYYRRPRFASGRPAEPSDPTTESLL